MSRRNGFTLIELIIVIAIIATIVAAVFVAIDPVRRLQDAREAQFASDAKQIRKAVELYLVDEGSIPAAYYPNGIVVTGTEVRDICAVGSSTPAAATANATANDCLDLGFLLSTTPTAGQYLPKIPVYSGAPDSDLSGYMLAFSSGVVTDVLPPVIASGGGGGSSSSSSSSSSAAPISRALAFGASNNAAYVSVPDNTALNFTAASQFSFSLWIKPDTVTSGPLFSKYDSGTSRGYSCALSNGKINCLLLDTFGNNMTVTSATSIPVSVYTHVVVVYDGSQAPANRVTIYLNGDPDPVTVVLNGYASTYAGTQPFLLGRFISGYFSGTMDEVRVYGRALTPAEVTQLSNASSGDDPSSPVAVWGLDSVPGSAIAAASPPALQGTLTGFADLNAAWTTDVFTVGGPIVKNAVDFLPYVHSVTKYVEVPAANYNFNLNTPFTLAAWVRTDDITSASQIQTIISKTDANARGFAMFTNTGKLFVSFGDSTNPYGIWISNNTALLQGQWTHVACAFSGNGVTPTTSNTKCYVNGGGSMTSTNPNTPNTTIANFTNAATVKIGAGNVFWFGGTNAIGKGFNGAIDEVRIYNAELSQAQVATLANANQADDPPSTNLVGFWKFNENTGTSTPDKGPALGTADTGNFIGSLNRILAPAGVPQ